MLRNNRNCLTKAHTIREVRSFSYVLLANISSMSTAWHYFKCLEITFDLAMLGVVFVGHLRPVRLMNKSLRMKLSDKRLLISGCNAGKLAKIDTSTYKIRNYLGKFEIVLYKDIKSPNS